MISAAGTSGTEEPPGIDAQEVVPAAAHAAAMAVDELAEGDAHLLLDVAGLVDVPGDAEELGAGVVRLAEPREPGAAAAQDRRRDRDRLDVVDGRRAAVEAHIGRERRLQPRHALLALEAFEQRRLLAADIGAGAVVDVAVEREAVDVVLADQPRLIGLVDGALQRLALADVFAADVDVGGVRPHGEAGDEAALDEEMRIVPHDLPVLAGAGLRLVGVDDEVVRAAVRLLRHERPFEPGREAGAAAPAQARLLHLVDDPVAALVEEEPGFVPGAALARRLEARRVQAVEVGEDAVAVVQHVISRFRPRSSARPASSRCRRGALPPSAGGVPETGVGALGVGGGTALLRLRRRRRVGLVALRRRPALRPLIVRRDGGFRRIGGALRVVGADRRLALLGPLRRRVGLLGLDRAAGVGLCGFGLRRSARGRSGGLACGVGLLDRLLLEALPPRSDERAVEERGVLQRLHGAGRLGGDAALCGPGLTARPAARSSRSFSRISGVRSS